jgi:hypothetical protein
LFSDLIKALHDESEALIANDPAGLADANGRKEHSVASARAPGKRTARNAARRNR